MWYFSVSCQISAYANARPLTSFQCSASLLLKTCKQMNQNQKRKTDKRNLIYNLKCWQLNPKICQKDFIDFWFNSVRLLNHVKVTLSKPFTRGMKSVLSSRIGPMPLLCRCPPFAVWLLQGSKSVWFKSTTRLPPPPLRLNGGVHAKANKRKTNKQTENHPPKNTSNRFTRPYRSSGQGHIVLPIASSAALVHVDKLTSTLWFM